MRGLNGSKRNKLHVPIPDLHNKPLPADPDADSADYAAGRASGERFAVEAASFQDLDRLGEDARDPATVVPPWTRGFLDAVADAIADFNGVPVTVNR